MKSALTKRPQPIPQDVLEQLREIQHRQRRQFVETHYIALELEKERQLHHWLSDMIEKGHRV